MILHLAWKFVCKLSSSWLLIPQNLLIFSSQLMNNCSDWELFGNNLSCKKTMKTTTFIGEKSHPYWVEGVSIDEEEGDCLRHFHSFILLHMWLSLTKNLCLGFFGNGPTSLKKKKQRNQSLLVLQLCCLLNLISSISSNVFRCATHSNGL